jgi:hypothetical protein
MKDKARSKVKSSSHLEVRIEYRAVPEEESGRRLRKVFDLLLKNLEDDVSKSDKQNK